MERSGSPVRPRGTATGASAPSTRTSTRTSPRTTRATATGVTTGTTDPVLPGGASRRRTARVSIKGAEPQTRPPSCFRLTHRSGAETASAPRRTSAPAYLCARRSDHAALATPSVRDQIVSLGIPLRGRRASLPGTMLAWAASAGRRSLVRRPAGALRDLNSRCPFRAPRVMSTSNFSALAFLQERPSR